MTNNIVNSISSGRLSLKKQLISNKDLLFYYPLDEGGGDVAHDFSGNGFHGTLIANPNWVDGKKGKCLKFNGINQYVNTGIKRVNNNIKSISISLWIKTVQETAGEIIGNVSSSYFRMQLSNPSSLFRGQSATKALINTHTDIVNNNKWHHLCGIIENKMNHFYIDGVKKSVYTSDFLGNMGNANNILIGARPTGVVYFDGLIDEIYFYNRALSPSEVAILYNNT